MAEPTLFPKDAGSEWSIAPEASCEKPSGYRVKVRRVEYNCVGERHETHWWIQDTPDAHLLQPWEAKATIYGERAAAEKVVAEFEEQEGSPAQRLRDNRLVFAHILPVWGRAPTNTTKA